RARANPFEHERRTPSTAGRRSPPAPSSAVLCANSSGQRKILHPDERPFEVLHRFRSRLTIVHGFTTPARDRRRAPAESTQSRLSPQRPWSLFQNQIAQEEQAVGRPLRQPPHQVEIPFVAEGCRD